MHATGAFECNVYDRRKQIARVRATRREVDTGQNASLHFVAKRFINSYAKL